jgi:hypothetical protein
MALARMIRRDFPWVHTISAVDRCSPMHTSHGDQMSLHSIGRALDVMMPGLHGGSDGEALANWLVEHAEDLGVQFVIWNHSRWQGSYPVNGRGQAARFAPYTGPNPHVDHVHVEVSLAPGPAVASEAAFADPNDPAWLNFTSSPGAVPVPIVSNTPRPTPPTPPTPPQTVTAAPARGDNSEAVFALALLLVALSRRKRS